MRMDKNDTPQIKLSAHSSIHARGDMDFCAGAMNGLDRVDAKGATRIMRQRNEKPRRRRAGLCALIVFRGLEVVANLETDSDGVVVIKVRPGFVRCACFWFCIAENDVAYPTR